MDAGQSIAKLGLTADLRTDPWRYPGPFLPFSCLQVGDQLVPLDALPDSDDCHFVIAIGSNASPDVMRRKFERWNVSTTIPHLLARLDGVALGHSAHVSLPGYIAAAPFPHADSSTNVVVSALTQEQRDCLDQTEPNYDRIAVPRRLLHIPADLPPVVHIYASKRGVIVDDASVPLRFGAQDTTFRRLAEWGILPSPIDLSDGAPIITRMLGEQDELRDMLTKELARRSMRFSWDL